MDDDGDSESWVEGKHGERGARKLNVKARIKKKKRKKKW